MLPHIIDGRSFSIHRLQQELPELDLISWLQNHSLYPKIFWKEKDSQITRAAVGALLSFPHIPTITEPSPFDLRFYGGFRFHPKTGQSPKKSGEEIWRGFPACSFWLPEVEISQQDSHTEAVVYSLNAAPSAHLLGIPQSKKNPVNNVPPELKHFPDFVTWKMHIDDALEKISRGALDKIVLARRTSLFFSHPISPWPLFNRLCEKARAATLFAFQLSPDLCFMGATPERLFQRAGSQLTTDAVAATRRRGRTPDEDLRLEKELLFSTKDQREFGIVKEFLTSTLSPLAEAIGWEGPDRILKTSHVQHIYNRIHVQLKNAISDADLVAALHPTPSLGGYPRKAALDSLSQIESFERGWYGAPLGVISPGRSSLHVAIRSGLICQHTLHLFAGTGIVHGSAAAQEWEELDQKILPFMEILENS